MERLERFYKIDQLLKDSKVVPFARLKEMPRTRTNISGAHWFWPDV